MSSSTTSFDSVSSIQHIVEYLRQSPFNHPMSIVEFSNKSPTELLQIVNDVFTVFDSKQSKTIRDDDPQLTAARMLEFLVVLGYKFSDDSNPTVAEEFGPAFISGDIKIIYPLLLWLLTRVESLKKRAYLARYLRPIEVPEEYFIDASVVSLFQQYKSKQAEFKDIHKLVDKARETALNPASLQQQVEQLELEREQLNNKLSKLTDKYLNSNNNDNSEAEFHSNQFNQMLSATNLLRQEQEEENRLYQYLSEQELKLNHSTEIMLITQKKLAEIQSTDINRTDPQKLIQKLKSNNNQLKIALTERNNLVNDREKSLKLLTRDLTSERLNENQVNDLLGQYQSITNEIQTLESKLGIESNRNGSDGQLTFLRDRISSAEKRRLKLESQLTELNNEKKELINDIQRLANDLALLISNTGIQPKSDAEQKKYMAELTNKTNKYKLLKSELESIKAEIVVLSSTESVLKSRNNNLIEFNLELEKSTGLSGFTVTEDNLASISQLKSTIDINKGETLESISSIVNQINSTLKEKKTKLAPQIKELRNERHKFEEIESVYFQRKSMNDNLILNLHSERVKLESDLNENLIGIQEEESSYHFLRNLINIAQSTELLIINENKYLNNEEKFPIAPYKSYSEMIEKLITAEEIRSKQLRNEKKYQSEKQDTYIKQKQLFYNLKLLLTKKLQAVNGELTVNNNNNNSIGNQLGFNSNNNNSNQSQRQQQDDLMNEADRMVFD